jgi:FkbM family methyltransferase
MSAILPMATAKEHVQRLLGRMGVYERVKASWLYDLFWGIADKRIIDDRRKEIEFYSNLWEDFRRGDLVFDIGANQGYKSDIFLRLGARVVAVEPDEKCQLVLKEKFLKYRLRGKPLTLVNKAVSDQNSVQTMCVASPGSALNTLSSKWAETLSNDEKRFGEKVRFEQLKQVETVSIEHLVGLYGLPFFIKIDVEGHELSVLRGMQQPVPYLSFEVNLPEFRSEGQECVKVLERLTKDGRFNYASDCRTGLRLKHWVAADEFSASLSSCADPSIEIFWRTPVRRTHLRFAGQFSSQWPANSMGRRGRLELKPDHR